MDIVQSFPRMILASQSSSDTDSTELRISGQRSTARPTRPFLLSLQLLVHTTPPTLTLTKLVHPVHRMNQGSGVKNSR